MKNQFTGLRRYLPKIGTPEEMSPISQITQNTKQDLPPIIEIRPNANEERSDHH